MPIIRCSAYLLSGSFLKIGLMGFEGSPAMTANKTGKGEKLCF